MASQFIAAVEAKLPKTKIVFDKWHVLEPVLRAMDRARIHTQSRILENSLDDKNSRQQAEENSRLLKKHRYLFKRRRYHNFNTGLRNVLSRYLTNYPFLATVYNLKESFFDIWSSRTAEEASRRIDNWMFQVQEESRSFNERYRLDMRRAKSAKLSFRCDEIDPVILFSKPMETFTKHKKYVVSYFELDQRITNAATEAANGRIKLAVRLGRGYQFETLRARMLWSEPDIIKTAAKHPTKITSTIKANKQSSATKEYYRIPNPEVTTHQGKILAKCASPGCKQTIFVDPSCFNDKNSTYYVPAGYEYCIKCVEYRASDQRYNSPGFLDLLLGSVDGGDDDEGINTYDGDEDTEDDFED